MVKKPNKKHHKKRQSKNAFPEADRLMKVFKWSPKELKEETEYVNTTSLKSRLDECMTRLETAVAEAISKLKEMI